MAGRTLGFRCPPDIEEALTRACQEETRTRAHQILHLVRRGLIDDGYLPGDEEDELGADPTDQAA